ncbi:hypothetical protein FNV43_RR11059 [Rhamnella rubrinervis]|uniref:Uncharacterized protein n=1 Tax=Rhamnella rubrinervis TaxID=2594499 RepID=A0A8K0MHD7_9ROSA|nr:hypothetical protein FNV43_RR11059 [Rhamnella rubrinervis]
MSDSLSSDREIYEYEGNGTEYSDDTNVGEFTQNMNSEDCSTQSIRGDPQGIKVFVITDIRSSIKTTERPRRFLLPFGMNPNVVFRVPDRDGDPNRPKVGEVVFHIALFEYRLSFPLCPVFRKILHRWELAPKQLIPNS